MHKLARHFLALALVPLLLSLAGPARAIEKIPPDPKAVTLVNALLSALSLPDEAARLKAVLPLVHKSLKTADGADLDANIKRFSYAKASAGAGRYAQPAVIHEVHKGNTLTVGFKETAEKGRKDKYFVKKKEGSTGMPAPIVVFWPEGGGEPVVLDMGSL